MIFTLLLLLQASSPTPLPPDVEVVGQRLKMLRLSIDMVDGRLDACRPTVSSGDKFIDAKACEAVAACVANGVRDTQRLLPCVDNRIRAAVAYDAARHVRD